MNAPIVICKHNPETYSSPIYLIIDEEVTAIGILTKTGISKLLQYELIELIESTEIIEKYFFSELIIKGVQNHIYFSLGA
jgi:hypothetical protein